MRLSYSICICLILISLPVRSGAETTESPFSLSWETETLFWLAGISSQIAGNHALSEVTPKNPETLDTHTINGFDRFATDFYSKKLNYLSDDTRTATIALLTAGLVPHFMDDGGTETDALLTDMVIILEAEMLVTGITACSKGLWERPRPYAYNPRVPLRKRGSRYAFESFWSGHASVSFTNAVLAGYLFQHRFPDSRFVLPVWVTGMSLASATSFLRVRSGYHFPTDVIAGAAMGTFIGWVVPRMHQGLERRVRCEIIPGKEGIYIEVSCRLK